MPKTRAKIEMTWETWESFRDSVTLLRAFNVEQLPDVNNPERVILRPLSEVEDA